MALARSDLVDEPATQADADDDDTPGPIVLTRPAVGFFIAGSNDKNMNGVYVQQAPPQYDDDEPGTETLLYYCHTQNMWTMECVSRSHVGAAWVLVDETGRECFRQQGSKLVPGAGVRWSHCDAGGSASHNALEMRTDDGAVAVAGAGDGDEADDTLPWQVIAILDRDTLQQVCAGADAHRARVRAEAAANAESSGLRDGPSASAGAAEGAERGEKDGESVQQAELDALAAEPDHYVVLGVACDATPAQLVQAYRMSSLKYHPDRRGGSTKAFQRVQLAYATLADDEQRAAYDAGGPPTAAGDDHTPAFDARWRREEYCPFGDPFVHRRKLVADRQRQRREAEARAAKGSGKPRSKRSGKEAEG